MVHLLFVLLCTALAQKPVTGGRVTGHSAGSKETGAIPGSEGLVRTWETSGSSRPGKLLVVPMDGSHWSGLKAMAEELGRKGHAVLVVMPEVSMRLTSGKHYVTKKFPVPYKKDLLDKIMASTSRQLSVSTTGPLERILGLLGHFREIHDLLISTTESLLFNEELMHFLRNQKFDAVLTDPAMPTGAILAYNLSLPAVYLLRGLPCGMDARATACPDPPSYVPRFFTKNRDRMRFGQRVLNALVYVLEPVMCKLVYWGFEEVASRFLQRSVALEDVLNTAAVWLLRYDFTMEFPKPLAPNMVLIAGMNCAITSPLESELLEFVEGSEHGIVVFTLGSLVSAIPKEKAAIFFQAFSRIPQRVLWRHAGELPDRVPDNVKLREWLPQNELLGHPKTRAFITHGGSHSINEGICHGVPMVMLPLFGDQGDNVHRLASRGVGVVLNFFELTSDMLVAALDAVVNGSSYKERTMKLSALHNDRPTEPLDLAVYWTEYVMRHKGAAHLRLAAYDLNWFQYHSVDVIGFLLVVAVTGLVVGVKCCALCLSCCRKVRKRKVE